MLLISETGRELPADHADVNSRWEIVNGGGLRWNMPAMGCYLGNGRRTSVVFSFGASIPLRATTGQRLHQLPDDLVHPATRAHWQGDVRKQRLIR
jgi:hypothetical protein